MTAPSSVPPMRLRNSLTRAVEPFRPLDPENVRLYLCGPTVYDRAHLGNARNVILFDLLFRLLRHDHGEGSVTYVRNFTDIDDKIIARAAESGEEIETLTARTTRWYLEDMAALGTLEPTHMPRATDYIAQMVEMIETLVAEGHAYTQEGHTLFSVGSYPGYGALSGRDTEDMIAGARVEVAPYKRDPMDFVLWKPSGEDEPGWETALGYGRPGWHIECSAMARALLGPSFDIHGGGNDLMFPHHENERAQSCCADPGAGFASVWLHNEMLLVEGRKMSKSLGNFFTVRDLLDGHDGQPAVPGEVIRFVMLSTHYRKPMDWTAEKAAQAEATLRTWHSVTEGAEPGAADAELVGLLSDDLNSAGALTRLHKLAKDAAGDPTAAGVLLASAQLLGLLTDELGDWVSAGPDLSGLADHLAGVRAAAMETKDFSEVDRLKAALIDAGVEVRMSKAGVELLPGAGFDAAKLEGLL